MAVVYFDLETTDFYCPEIIQIGAKHGKRSFCCYVRPQSKNPRMATHIHGFTYFKGTLFQDEEAVESVPLKRALILFLKFLRRFNNQCLLVAHNVSFDAHNLLKAINRYCMADEYRNCVVGFGDTCPILKDLVQDIENHKLGTLAEYFNIDCDRLHDAWEDARIMEEVFFEAGGTARDLGETSKTFDWYIERRSMLDRKDSMNVLREVLSKNMIRNIAEAGISMDDIYEAFDDWGWDGLWDLFEYVVSGKVLKRIVNTVGSFLEE